MLRCILVGRTTYCFFLFFCFNCFYIESFFLSFSLEHGLSLSIEHFDRQNACEICYEEIVLLPILLFFIHYHLIVFVVCVSDGGKRKYGLQYDRTRQTKLMNKIVIFRTLIDYTPL